MAVPNVVLTFSNNLEIRTFAPTTNKNVEYEVIFDPTEWAITRVTWDIGATQTYSALGQVYLDLKAAIVSKTPDGSAVMGEKTLNWNLLVGAFDLKTWAGARDVGVTGTAPEQVFVRMDHVYRIGLPALTEQVCSINETVKVVLAAKVANPATTPVVGTPTETDTNPPPGGGWNLGSFFGGLSTGIVVALAAIVFLTLRK